MERGGGCLRRDRGMWRVEKGTIGARHTLQLTTFLCGTESNICSVNTNGSRRRTSSDSRGSTLRPPLPPSPIPQRVLHTAGRLLPTPSPSSSSASEREIGLSRGAVPCLEGESVAPKKLERQDHDQVKWKLSDVIHYNFQIGLSVKNHWQLVVICNKGDNDMPFLMLLDSLHMGEPPRIKNELKNFLKIAYEGKEMIAVADELKVIDLHVPKDKIQDIKLTQ
ncbi:hypothetical protein Taro_010429 [Colocasia esculenta]|uniref:Uncharacterized protein n=1 Tax=Colocasia esculenta TaxID=4460 RepID=A0A843U6X6_COLES|nr:hypothetical protein [Colocasia esculenta]